MYSSTLIYSILLPFYRLLDAPKLLSRWQLTTCGHRPGPWIQSDYFNVMPS